jgi:hypothetical protein
MLRFFSVKAVKYIHKYIFKGGDRLRVTVEGKQPAVRDANSRICGWEIHLGSRSCHRIFDLGYLMFIHQCCCNLHFIFDGDHFSYLLGLISMLQKEQQMIRNTLD